MNVRLIPYRRYDGVPTFRDSEIMALYHRMQADGTADTCFFDGSVINPLQFLQCMQGHPNRLYVFIEENLGQIGIAWINQVQAKRAAIHFCTFSNVWGRRDLPEVGSWAVQRLLRLRNPDGEYSFDMFWGLTPTENKLAIRFAQRIGGNMVGILPLSLWNASRQQSVDGALFSFVRKEGEHEDLYQSRD